MANLMSMVKLKNKVSRNGFDLSRKNIFSAKVGELLPVACLECLPGDKFKINTQSFTRTMPVNTAAYTRIREYFDWYFVPSNLIWNKFNTWVTQMGDNNQHAYSARNFDVEQGKIAERLPYCRLSDLTGNINTMTTSKDIFGYDFVPKAAKLLSYLDYGQLTVNTETNKINENLGIVVNPFPLFAYQKIYADYFRNSQWEKPFAPAFNLDYSLGGDIAPYLNSGGFVGELCQLRYCNWNKDLFTGVLPQAQFGDSASINGATLINSFYEDSPNVESHTDSLKLEAPAVETLAKSLGFSLKDVNGDSLVSMFNVLQLRQAEAKQKWAEITQSQQQDYQSQVKAHFNVNVSNAYSERCRYLGGSSSNIDITEVVNTNLTTSDKVAEIAGKGVGSGNGYVDFDCDVHGYLMCIYHALPLLDYANSGIPKMLTKTLPTDFAIPEFDAVGMTQLSVTELTTGINSSKFKNLFGYVPRYYDYKTAVDKVHGAFVDGGLDSWVAPMSDTYISKVVESWSEVPAASSVFPFFKVNPAVLEPIFTAVTDSETRSDQLLINSYFDIKAVRNLDVNGLPY